MPGGENAAHTEDVGPDSARYRLLVSYFNFKLGENHFNHFRSVNENRLGRFFAPFFPKVREF